MERAGALGTWMEIDAGTEYVAPANPHGTGTVAAGGR